MRSFARLSTALALTVTVLLPVYSHAQNEAKPQTQTGPTIASIAPLKEFQERTKARLEYMGTKYGLDVWLASHETDIQTIYTTGDKKGLLIDNTLYSTGPTDETAAIQRDFMFNNPDKIEDIMQKVGATRMAQLDESENTASATTSATAHTTKNPAAEQKPRSNRGEQLWEQLSITRSIDFGSNNAPSTAFMLVDPNCQHCHSLWNKIDGQLKDHTLNLRLVPVAILGKSSEQAVAQLLSQSNLQDAWTRIVKKETLTEASQPSGAAGAVLNQKILRDFKLTTTPLLVYRQNGTGKVRLIAGDFPDTEKFFVDALPTSEGKTETKAENTPKPATESKKTGAEDKK
jgi:protein-disulfide isomerase